jgi:hypothetical protein
MAPEIGQLIVVGCAHRRLAMPNQQQNAHAAVLSLSAPAKYG